MKISNRLKSIASLVTNEDIIADIGCDHAYLDIYLVKNKIIDKAYVSDVNYSALNNGIKNIKKYNLEDKIDAKLSDGISSISEDVNTIVISGMGASTIIKILDNPKINQINKLILFRLIKAYYYVSNNYDYRINTIYNKIKEWSYERN